MYERDFKILSKEEKKVRDQHFVYLKDIGWKTVQNDWVKTFELYDRYPAIPFSLSLFPNNRISPGTLDGRVENSRPQEVLDAFIDLLNKPEKVATERDVLNQINGSFGYFIIASIVKDFTNWGHHEIYVFKEFPLGTNYKADYLVVGKNSEGYHFLFVELEAPYESTTIEGGKLGSSFRKGLHQVDDWAVWLEKYFSHLKPIYDKHKSSSHHLPDEFSEYDSTRISYAVVAGRRDDFNQRTYRERRNRLRNNRTILLHYDNLIDSSRRLIYDRGFGGSVVLTRKGFLEADDEDTPMT